MFNYSECSCASCRSGFCVGCDCPGRHGSRKDRNFGGSLFRIFPVGLAFGYVPAQTQRGLYRLFGAYLDYRFAAAVRFRQRMADPQ